MPRWTEEQLIIHESRNFKREMQVKHADKVKAKNANQLTKLILANLNSSGYVAWRNNVMGVFDSKQAATKLSGKTLSFAGIKAILSKCYRKSHERKGVSDVIGFHKATGRMIAIEVKFGKDQLSTEQKYFLQQVNKAGGIGIVAKTYEGFIIELTDKENGTK